MHSTSIPNRFRFYYAVSNTSQSTTYINSGRVALVEVSRDKGKRMCN